MRAILIAAGIVMITASAQAQSATSATVTTRQLLDAQVQAINAGDAKAFAATLSDEAFLILPAAADEVAGTGAADLEAAAKRWLARIGKVAVKVETAHFSRENDRSNAAWFDAALVAGKARWRITGVMARPLIQGDDSASVGPFRIVAAHISEAVDDRTATAAAAAGKLPALPRLQTDAQASKALDPSKIASYVKHVSGHRAVSLIGSAPAERAVGKAAVTKLLTGWKSLALESQGYETAQDEPVAWGLEWSIGHVVARLRVGGKRVEVPYRVLMIIDAPSAVAEDHGERPKLVAAHFSVATR